MGSELGVQADRADVLSVEVLKPRSLLKLSPQFFTYRVPNPESRPIQVPSPNAHASKTRTIKKNLARAEQHPSVWNREISIKPGWWRNPVSPRRPRSRAINQALCHGWTGTWPVCFRGCRRHRPGYPSSVVSLLSLCSSRREGAGTLRLRLTVSEGHGYPLVPTNGKISSIVEPHCSAPSPKWLWKGPKHCNLP